MLVTVTVKSRQVTFESPYSNDEAVCMLRAHMARGRIMSSFANDLLQKLDEGKRLSRSQLNWVHKLVVDAEQRSQNRSAVEITGQSRKPRSHRCSHRGS